MLHCYRGDTDLGAVKKGSSSLEMRSLTVTIGNCGNLWSKLNDSPNLQKQILYECVWSVPACVCVCVCVCV